MNEHDMDTLMFFDAHREVLPLYQTFEDYLFDTFPIVHKRVQKTQITFSNRHVFACISFLRVRPKASALSRKVDTPFRLSKPEDLDDELFSWIQAAYVFSNAK